MSFSLVLLLVALYASGIYLLLDRTLTRVVLGVLLVGNATNLLLFLMADGFGAAPIIADGGDAITDPLPQAFILTAIVITFALTAFLLALLYRSWRLSSAGSPVVDGVTQLPAGGEEHDTLQDDEADVQLARTSTVTLAVAQVTQEQLADAHDFEGDGEDGAAGITTDASDASGDSGDSGDSSPVSGVDDGGKRE